MNAFQILFDKCRSKGLEVELHTDSTWDGDKVRSRRPINRITITPRKERNPYFSYNFDDLENLQRAASQLINKV